MKEGLGEAVEEGVLVAAVEKVEVGVELEDMLELAEVVGKGLVGEEAGLAVVRVEGEGRGVRVGRGEEESVEEAVVLGLVAEGVALPPPPPLPPPELPEGEEERDGEPVSVTLEVEVQDALGVPVIMDVKVPVGVARVEGPKARVKVPLAEAEGVRVRVLVVVPLAVTVVKALVIVARVEGVGKGVREEEGVGEVVEFLAEAVLWDERVASCVENCVAWEEAVEMAEVTGKEGMEVAVREALAENVGVLPGVFELEGEEVRDRKEEGVAVPNTGEPEGVREGLGVAVGEPWVLACTAKRWTTGEVVVDHAVTVLVILSMRAGMDTLPPTTRSE